METIGDKIRQLREEKKISRQDFCGDEQELSVRNLIRIEQGQSTPTLQTLNIIASRLNLPSYYLMADFQELPLRYKELKYLVQRQPVYGVREMIKQQEVYLDEIFEHYYWDLPNEEQLVIDYLQATIQLFLSEDLDYAQKIIDEGIDDFAQKELFSINDLSFARLMAAYFHFQNRRHYYISPKYSLIFDAFYNKILRQSELFSINDLFIYSNCIFSALSYYDAVGNYALIPSSLVVLQDILKKTQDYQKKPLVTMLEWKQSLFIEQNIPVATEKFQEARLLAQLLGIEVMFNNFEKEWESDLEKYAKKKYGK